MWESSWYVSSNWCGGSAMHFYWNIWKSRSDNNDRNFSLVMGYFEMIYREISHEWLDQFLPQELILPGATNFYALESRRSLVPVYFKNCFGANFEYLLNSRYQSAKPTDLKIIFSFVFLLDNLYVECSHRHGGDSIFAGKNCPKMYPKINWSLKTPWHKPLIWKLLSPAYGLLVSQYTHGPLGEFLWF